MANSTSNIDAISVSQASKEVTANAFFDAASQAATYGRRASTSSGLTWGYYGGNVVKADASMAQIANGTLTLTASATSYIVAAKATGAVSAATTTTNWDNTTDYWRLYSVVAGSSTVTSYTDSRTMGAFQGAGSGGGGGMSNPMTTAGDIITGGASGAPQRIAVGSDGQVLKVVTGAPAWVTPGSGTGTVESIVAGAGISVDDTDPANPVVSATGGGGGGTASAINRIINGDFAINQRGYVSGSTTSAGKYTLDRWKVTGTGGITFSTISNKTIVTIPSGQTLQQVVEGSNLQSSSYVLSWEGTAQGRIGGGAYGSSGSVIAVLTGGADATIEFNAGTVADVQLESGTTATAFERRLYGIELLLCKRYYWRKVSGSPYTYFGSGQVASSTQAVFHVPYATEMRSTPTFTTSGTSVYDSAVARAVTGVGAAYAGTQDAGIVLNTSSGLTAANPAIWQADNNVNAYIDASAEL